MNRKPPLSVKNILASIAPKSPVKVAAVKPPTTLDDEVVRNPTLDKIKALYKAGKRPTVNPLFDGTFDGRLVYDPAFMEFHENSKKDMVNFRPLIDPYYPSPDVSGNMFYEFFTCNPIKMDYVPLPLSSHRELLNILDEHIGSVSPIAWQNPEDSDDLQHLFSNVLTFLFGGQEFWDGIARRSCLVVRLDLPMSSGNAAVQLEPREPSEKIAHIYMTPFDVHPLKRPDFFTVLLKWMTEYVAKPKDYFYYAAVNARKGLFSSSIQYAEFIEKTLRGMVIQRAKGSLPLRDEKYKILAEMKQFLEFRTDRYYTGDLPLNERAAPMLLPYHENITEMARYTWWIEYFARVDSGTAPDNWLFSSTETLEKYHEIVLENFHKVAVIYQHAPKTWKNYCKDGKFEIERLLTNFSAAGLEPRLPLPKYTKEFFEFNEKAKTIDVTTLGWNMSPLINMHDPLNIRGPRCPPDFNTFYFGHLPRLVQWELHNNPSRFSNPRKALLHCLCCIELGVYQYLAPKFMIESHMVSLMNQLLDAVFFAIQLRLGGTHESFKPAVKEFSDTFGVPTFRMSNEMRALVFKDVYLNHYATASDKASGGGGVVRSLQGNSTRESPHSTFQFIDWDNI